MTSPYSSSSIVRRSSVVEGHGDESVLVVVDRPSIGHRSVIRRRRPRAVARRIANVIASPMAFRDANAGREPQAPGSVAKMNSLRARCDGKHRRARARVEGQEKDERRVWRMGTRRLTRDW